MEHLIPFIAGAAQAACPICFGHMEIVFHGIMAMLGIAVAAVIIALTPRRGNLVHENNP
jgi:hypothetical protein